MYSSRSFIAISRRGLWALWLALALTGCGSSSEGMVTDPVPSPGIPEPALADSLPIVFVHGAAGSGQQFHSQAMRYVANGVPPERIRVYEYDAGVEGIVQAAAGAHVLPLYQFLLDLTAEFGVDQVYLIGHSLGTIVSTEYLASGFATGPLPVPAPANLVAKFVGVDGMVSPICPGLVPCLGIFAGQSTVGLGQDNAYIDHQAHVQVCTSAESFEAQFEFLYGFKPQIVDIQAPAGMVSIAGRAVNFPQNTGRSGSTLEVWPIDSESGHRSAPTPLASLAISDDGRWGPVEVSTQKHHEFLIRSPDAVDHHFYLPRFERDTDLIRLLSGPDDSDTRTNTHVGPGHSAIVMSRMREWYGDHPAAGNDVVEISTRSPARGNQPPVNVITPAVGNDTIGIHIHDDAATPGQTTLQPLPYFPDQAFQTGVDVYMPATEPPDGTVTIRSMARGKAEAVQTLNFPNWASDRHRIGIVFNDYDR